MAAFSLYTRPRKKGRPIYYAQFKTATGKWSTAKSTGCMTRRDAEKWCEDFLHNKGHFTPGSSVTFQNFSKYFFLLGWGMGYRKESKWQAYKLTTLFRKE